MRWLLLLLALLAPAASQARPINLEDHKAEFAAFEAEDKATPFPKGETIFVGSSSIRMWTALVEDMAPTKVLNRGFGGSHLPQVTDRFDLLLTHHRPSRIVIYCGENDIAAERPVSTVIADFEAFMATKDHKLGRKLPVYFISIKPSVARAEQLAQQREVNDAVRAMAEKRGDLHYIDVATAMMGADGKVRPDLFGPDNLHMNPTGYTIWTGIVRRELGVPAR